MALTQFAAPPQLEPTAHVATHCRSVPMDIVERPFINPSHGRHLDRIICDVANWASGVVPANSLG